MREHTAKAQQQSRKQRDRSWDAELDAWEMVASNSFRPAADAPARSLVRADRPADGLPFVDLVLARAQWLLTDLASCSDLIHLGPHPARRPNVRALGDLALRLRPVVLPSARCVT